MGRRRRGLSFCVFAEERGAGVPKGLDLALVVFMPSGARVRGPRHVSCRLAQSPMSSLTGWRHKGILVDLAALVGGEELVSLARFAHGIFVVERDLERRLGGFVAGCFGVEALEAGIERLARRTRVQMTDGVLLVVCCESSHSGGYIERVVWLSLSGVECLRPVARAAAKRVWASHRVRAEVAPARIISLPIRLQETILTTKHHRPYHIPT